VKNLGWRVEKLGNREQKNLAAAMGGNHKIYRGIYFVVFWA